VKIILDLPSGIDGINHSLRIQNHQKSVCFAPDFDRAFPFPPEDAASVCIPSLFWGSATSDAVTDPVFVPASLLESAASLPDEQASALTERAALPVPTAASLQEILDFAF
jgi:hypothetical protein